MEIPVTRMFPGHPARRRRTLRGLAASITDPGGAWASEAGYDTWSGTTIDPATGERGDASTDACQVVRDQAAADIDAKTNDLAKNWRPTGYYYVEDMAKMIDGVAAIMSKASASVDAAAAAGASQDILTNLRGVQWTLNGKFSDGVATYGTAIQQARQQGIRVIDAAGFKAWVLVVMNKASVVTGYVAYAACLKPSIVSFVVALGAACVALVDLGKQMVAATIAVGEAILKVPSVIGDLWKYGKWVLLAGGAFMAWRVITQHLPGSGRSAYRVHGGDHHQLPADIDEDDVIDV